MYNDMRPRDSNVTFTGQYHTARDPTAISL